MPDAAATATTTSVWLVLLPVIIGGAIGMIGGVVGPPFVHHLQRKADKQRRRAEKFEELVATVYEYKNWLMLIYSARLIGEELELELSLSPIAKVRAISAVYFPQLDETLSELERLGDEFEVWMWASAQKRARNDIEGLNEGLKEVFRPFSQKVASVEQELKAFARREFD
jgi:hypothetical protein